MRTQSKTLEKIAVILSYIKEYQQNKGYSPSMRDIMVDCGISSTSLSVYYLEKLEMEGYIKRDKKVSRSIVICNEGTTEKSRINPLYPL